MQAHKPVREQREAVGHAVRAVYLYFGMADVAYYTKDKELYDVCEALFDDIRNRKMYITGAIGSSAHGEAFTFEYDLPNAAAYAETCASVGLVFFAHRMNRIKPHSKYYNIIERALYNTKIGAMLQDGKKYFYVNPLEVFPKEVEKRFDRHHVKPECQPWFGCACCPPNVARFLSALGRYVYSYNHDGIYVNLYIGSSVLVEVGGVKVLLQQVSSYPFEDMVKIDLKPSKEIIFKLYLRVPGWCESFEVYVNGKKEQIQKLENSYVCIERLWKENDQVTLKIPTEVKMVNSHPQVRSNVGKVAVVKGPVVFCAEEADNGKNLHLLFVDVNRKCKLEFDSNILGGLYTVEVDGFRMAEDDFAEELYKSHRPKFVPVKIKLIPYYAWANRGVGEMKVWLWRSSF